jgi:hypothetical protein
MRKFTKLMRLMMVVVLSLTMVVGFAQRVDLRTDTAPKQSPAKAAIEQQKKVDQTAGTKSSNLTTSNISNEGEIIAQKEAKMASQQEFYEMVKPQRQVNNPNAVVTVKPDGPAPTDADFLVEDWSSLSFATNGWTFSPSQPTNWSVTTGYGNPQPSAMFNYSPSITNYSYYLVSAAYNTTAAATLQLKYDYYLSNYSTATLEQMGVEVFDGTNWVSVANYTNSASFPWTPVVLNVTAYKNANFQMRFHVYGANSFNINNWNFDNIVITEPPATPIVVVTPASPFNYNNVQLGNSVTQQFVVTNTGGGVANVTGISIAGDASFTITGSATGNLPPDFVYADVTFAPTTTGPKTATLTITTSVGNLTVDLSGNGIPVIPNDDCVNATIVNAFPSTYTGTCNGAEIDCPGVLDWPAVWYRLDLPYTQNNVNINFCGTLNLYTVGVVYYLDCSNCSAYSFTSYSFITCPGGETAADENILNIAGPTSIYYPVYVANTAYLGIDFTVAFNVTEVIPGPGCGTTNLGTITPTSSWQQATYAAGSTYYWNFTGVGGTTYGFSNCGAGEDTYLRIYDGSYTQIATADDFGIYCNTETAASMDWMCPANGNYFVSLAHYSCTNLLNPWNLSYIEVPPCIVTCPPGGILEGEPDILDEGVDVTNGGCNSTPNVFLPIQCGETICGNFNTYLFGGSQYRDTDWYELDLSGTIGYTAITWTVTGEFPAVAIIISSPCPGSTITSATASPCQPAICTATVAPGIYYLWAGSSAFTGYPAGGDWDYNASVTCVPVSGGTGCENTAQYPSGTITVDGTGLITTISTCNYAQEYSHVTNIVSGQTYQFTMSDLGTGAYITITDGAGTSGNILTYGPSPLSWTATSNADLYAHWSLNEFCAIDVSCHTTTVQYMVPCTVTCPVGALQENEPEIPDEGVDVTNAGCNMLPATPLFMPIAFGNTYCGKTNTYLVGTTQRRDTDWYRIDLSTPACNWWNLTFTATAEFDLQILLLNAGTPEDCSNDVVVASAVVAPCDVATITGDFPSGVYYLWVGPSVFTGYPIATGPHDYVATLTGSLLGYSQLTPAPPAAITVTVPPAGSTTQNLTIGNSGTYQLDYTASTTGAWSLVTGDNFDSYIAGQQLACQAPAAWTTWSNLPCSATEDGYVSNTYAYNGANSAKIVQNNDQVKLLGDLSSGVYKFSFMQYIPSTKSGYFNTLSDFTFVTGGYWAFECYFNVGGAGALTANHVVTNFTWTPDVWKKVEVTVDLDNDVAEFVYDGVLVYSWPWTQGSSTGTGTLTIDAHDFFGAAATDEMYIDDYKLEFAGNDWLTLNGGLGVNGTVASGGPAVNVTLGFNAGSYPVGTYTKTINMSTNELCGAKNSYAINVTMYVGYAITGNVYYGAGNTKPMTSIGTITQVICTPGPTVTTGAGGAYDIRPLAGGATYLLTGFTNKPGTTTQITGADYIIVNRMAAGLGTPYTNLQYRAGDVNKSNTVTASDAILIKRRAAGLSSVWAAPVYVFDGPFPATPVLGGLPVIIGASNVVQDFRTLLSGDMNGSFSPAP